jgi:UDP-N-acetylglucosamine--N-acetylmuramyl-(pentapeptide) pyrophosphoryl-undecaprenol N-acetylglucosamine transferase
LSIDDSALKQQTRPISSIIITGGGTGGHLFPGIAMAEAILQNFPECTVVFISTERQIDGRALQDRPFTTVPLKCRGLKGMGLFDKLMTVLQLPASIISAMAIIRRYKPDLVFGVGGYVTGPVILAARFLGIPCGIHEQNSIPGLTNRLLGKIVSKIFICLPGSETCFPRRKTVLSGNPVRKELLAAAAEPRTEEKNRPALLVLGGSQGAHRVNMLVLEALAAQRSALPPCFTVLHQTGPHDEETVRHRYASLGIRAQVAAFFDKMARLYQQADLVVSRAGATTLAELMIFQKPAILIPYPYAADNHQELNGRFLVENGGARMFIEAELTAQTLGEEIIRLINNTKQRQELAANIGSLARPHAAETIVEHCLDML